MENTASEEWIMHSGAITERRAERKMHAVITALRAVMLSRSRCCWCCWVGSPWSSPVVVVMVAIAAASKDRYF